MSEPITQISPGQLADMNEKAQQLTVQLQKLQESANHIQDFISKNSYSDFASINANLASINLGYLGVIVTIILALAGFNWWKTRVDTQKIEDSLKSLKELQENNKQLEITSTTQSEDIQKSVQELEKLKENNKQLEIQLTEKLQKLSDDSVRFSRHIWVVLKNSTMEKKELTPYDIDSVFTLFSNYLEELFYVGAGVPKGTCS